MFILEIHASGTIIAEYTGDNADTLLGLAKNDEWIFEDWMDEYYIREDAWDYDGVRNVILYEKDDDGNVYDIMNIDEREDYGYDDDDEDEEEDNE